MTEINDQIDLDRLWQKLIAGDEEAVCISGLRGSSKALVLSQFQHSQPRPMLLVSSTPSEAERIYKDLLFFLQNVKGDQNTIPDFALFPQWEVLPFDDKSPLPEIVRSRLTTLLRLLQGENLIVITTIRALMQRILPQEVISRGFIDLKVGETIDLDQLTDQVIRCGYQRVDLVDMPGTYSRRGGIFDLFPPNYEYPVRLEFFGDEIESIRLFSPDDQRSFGQIAQVETILSREILLDPKARDCFQSRINHRDHPLAEGLESEEEVNGIEFYAPLFYPSMETLFHYLPKETITVLISADEIFQRAESFQEEVRERYDIALHQQRCPCEIEDLYMDTEELEETLSERRTLSFGLVPHKGEKEFHLQSESIGGLALPGKSRIDTLSQRIREFKEKTRICLAVRTKGQADRFMDLLSGEEKIPCTKLDNFSQLPQEKGTVVILVGALSTGFRFPLFSLICITEDDIFGVKRVHRPSRPLREGPFLTSLSELNKGDYVVHVDHGIGRYRGLREVCVEGIDRDLIQIEYAGRDLLYVPPEKIHLIQKYSGSKSRALQINKLGGSGWEKLKKKVKKSIEEMSRELIQLYAKRKMSTGTAYSPPDSLFKEFEETFEYEETPDQQKAILDVLKDMQKPVPMDRLVCGDVGFGKTEVAIRAAFKAVLDGKQVAILVPTTLLAQQHTETFSRRFSAFPLTVEMISRFKSRGEQKKTLQKLEKGEVDILIGTHRLLSKDVAFVNLGLVIIDEEQRFGVRHKEKLKQLRTEVDVLTLTATPIPRTLEMSFLGIRDISIISTPPEDRLSIYTKVARFSEGIIREAVMRELDRGGQIFFVHNRVMDIKRMADFVQRVVPEASVDVAHGQMDEKSLKEVMDRFLDQEVNLLVTTSIIESGLDIPNANTMIIHKPEEFGLGQLYQLRGRIGRMHHRAYAYLLTRSEKSMTREARMRLQVIQELTELGSGFQLAARDLEIRGAGNLLGSQQSGNIAAVGFDLYMQLIEEVAKEQKGDSYEPRIEPSILMQVTARIPKIFVREDRLRLDLYRRFASVEDEEDLRKIKDEMRDRFGTIPKELENLFRIIELRILAQRLHLLEILEQEKRVRFTFNPTTPVSQEKILKLMQSSPKRVRAVSEYQLELNKSGDRFSDVWAETKNLLQELA